MLQKLGWQTIRSPECYKSWVGKQFGRLNTTKVGLASISAAWMLQKLSWQAIRPPECYKNWVGKLFGRLNATKVGLAAYSAAWMLQKLGWQAIRPPECFKSWVGGLFGRLMARKVGLAGNSGRLNASKVELAAYSVAWMLQKLDWQAIRPPECFKSWVGSLFGRLMAIKLVIIDH